MAISNERFTTLFLNWWERSEKDFTLSDMEDICKDIGMTRSEFIELVSRSGEFIDKDGWTPEPEANKKVNTETGEGVFWKEYTEEEEDEEEDVSVGDSDQAILETALTQIGIPYNWEEDSEGRNYIYLENVENGKPTGTITTEVYFTKEGKFTGMC